MVVVYSDSGESRNSKEISYTVAEAEGFIELGDIVVQTNPDDKSRQTAKTIESSAPQEKKVVKKTRPQVAAVPKAKGGSKIIICFGDSLTYGTGAGTGMDYPSQLALMIDKPVINRGIPGDTTASALRRLERDVLSGKPYIVLITLGGNDLKNGISKNTAFRNLNSIVETIQENGATVIIGGLKFPGRDRGFGQGYVDLARQTRATLIPDIFAGIVDNPDLMSDPIHPNNAGYRIIAQRFKKALGSVKKTHQVARKKPRPTATKKPKQAAKIRTGQAAATAKADQSIPSSLPQTRDVTLAWDDVPNATAYNIYWSDKPGVSKQNGTKIANVKNPHKIEHLKKGKKYYFVVTAVNATGESKESEEFSFTVGE
jgi:lysophospholipase L1-like esterase